MHLTRRGGHRAEAAWLIWQVDPYNMGHEAVSLWLGLLSISQVSFQCVHCGVSNLPLPAIRIG